MLSTILILPFLAVPLFHHHVKSHPVVISTSSASTSHQATISEASPSKSKLSSRVPTLSERKVQYMPRTTPRSITGTPREQVEQFRYRLAPKGPNESEESFKAREEKKKKILQVRKNTHLNRIEKRESEGGSPEEVKKKYEEWVQIQYRRVNLHRTKQALNKQDLTEEEYKRFRLEKEEEDAKIEESYRLKKEVKANAQRKGYISKTLKTSDEHKALLARERMQRHGIKSLQDGRKEGAKKTKIRKMLNLAPYDERVREEARKLGMNPDVKPAYKQRPVGEESKISAKRPRTTSVDKRVTSTETGVIPFQAQKGDQGTSNSHSNGIFTHAGSTSLLPSTSTPAKKTILPFDVNTVPPTEEE